MPRSELIEKLVQWIKTRRGGSFVLLLALFIVLGTILTALALVLAGLNGGKRLEVAGSFASGVAAFFGLTAVSAALIANYVLGNRETRDAEELWTAKLRVEEALTYYPILWIYAAKVRIQETDAPLRWDDPELAKSPFVKLARENLDEALGHARRLGLPRALSIISKEAANKVGHAPKVSPSGGESQSALQKEALEDLGVQMLAIEALNKEALNRGGALERNVLQLITTKWPVYDKSSHKTEDTSPMSATSKISYDDMSRLWTRKWALSDNTEKLANGILHPEENGATRTGV